jgi:hypothetical protein
MAPVGSIWFVSSARAERFGPRHTLIPLPVCGIQFRSRRNRAKRRLIAEPRRGRSEWSASDGSVDEPTDSRLVAEIATHANAMAIYDPGRYRFLLGASASIRFVSRSNGGLPFLSPASTACTVVRSSGGTKALTRGTDRHGIGQTGDLPAVDTPGSSRIESTDCSRAGGITVLLHDLPPPLWAAVRRSCAESARPDRRSITEESIDRSRR